MSSSRATTRSGRTTTTTSGATWSGEGIRWLREQHPDTFDAVVERPIDLTTMDGMTDYGMPLASVRALTIDEYRKYRHLIPLTDEPYWLATGWTTQTLPVLRHQLRVLHLHRRLCQPQLCPQPVLCGPAPLLILNPQSLYLWMQRRAEEGAGGLHGQRPDRRTVPAEEGDL